ncbi:hypothetical protein [Verrucomicrobium spinosum]|uniref:hypothetical protein n=1 Tax=Verrucomicrobium spinosum TaxID=2736 RepID=UPI0009465929|nr:hypothetical protein [Verrucomicrobium spinosum]
MIPRSALHEDGGKNIVWIIENGHVVRRAVSVSLTQGDHSTIAAGLSNGERVVVSATAPLKEGTRVKETKS